MTNLYEIYYGKTQDNIYKNINIFGEMLIVYYNFLLLNKENDIEYMKANYNLDYNFDIFNEYIVETKNIGIFTIFNNIPDIVHPLEKDIYFKYSPYVSFLDPSFFKMENNNIFILNKNIFEHDSSLNGKKLYNIYYYKSISLYNKYKKYIYLNIKYFNFKKYSDNLLIVIDKFKNIYSIQNNQVKQKKLCDSFKNIKIKKNGINKEFKVKIKEYKWIDVNIKINFTNLIYICVLRSININDINNVFNKTRTIQQNTKLYTFSRKILDENYNAQWFTLHKEEYYISPFLVDSSNKPKPKYQYFTNINKDLICTDLTVNILSNNKLSKSEDMFDFLNTEYVDNKITYDEKYKNKIFNYVIEYIIIENNIQTAQFNKRFLREIIFKNSDINLINIYYIDFLKLYNIENFIYSYGYYNNYNKFYSPEVYIEINNFKLELFNTTTKQYIYNTYIKPNLKLYK